jgi:hypothetical protein
MSDLLSRFNFGELISFLAVGGGLLIGLVAVAGGLWTEVRKSEIAAALKHDMLNRGMSAEDIQTVLTAGKKRSDKSSECRSACA